MRTYRRIIVPVDGSPTSNKALVAALNIARDGDGRLRLIHALDELAFVTGFEAGGEVLAAVRAGGARILAEGAEIAKAAGVNFETMLSDKPGQRLGESVANAAKVWNADLIVVGTHGRHGIERVLLHKYYIDELYDRVIVRPTVWISRNVLATGVDEGIIDKLLVTWVGTGIPRLFGWFGSRLQSGQVGTYAWVLLIGVIAVLGAFTFR